MDTLHLVDLAWSLVRGIAEVAGGLATFFTALWMFGEKIISLINRHWLPREEFVKSENGHDAIHERMLNSATAQATIQKANIEKLGIVEKITYENKEALIILNTLEKERQRQHP